MELPDGPRPWAERKGKLLIFCDMACGNQYKREVQKTSIEELLNHLKSVREHPEFKNVQHMRRFTIAYTIFFNSLLARKPHEELTRLYDLARRTCCEVVELAMETNLDELAFRYGEFFKMDYEHYIDAWAQ